MEQKVKRILVSGGAGFIGSALVRMLVREGIDVINVDALTYAGNLDNLENLSAQAEGINKNGENLKSAVQGSQGKHFFHQLDICNAEALQHLFMQTQPDAVLHLAAETHVDRSIASPHTCVQTNIMGTLNMLEAARAYWGQLPLSRQQNFRFLHVSTDEVYGDIASDALAVDEQGHYAPGSPYAASKAGADHLVRAWHKTYGLPVLLTHSCNNYGAFQHPEKLIPHMILNALAGKPLPIYGNGLQQRQWLFVDDHVRALWQVLRQGRVGDTYHIGVEDSAQSGVENIHLVRMLCAALEEIVPARQAGIGTASYASLITHTPDRPGHDKRYALATRKIVQELGWQPQTSLEEGLRQTVEWYVNNRLWWQQVMAKGYDLHRQG